MHEPGGCERSAWMHAKVLSHADRSPKAGTCIRRMYFIRLESKFTFIRLMRGRRSPAAKVSRRETLGTLLGLLPFGSARVRGRGSSGGR
jgi:hypothetical protein